jgi:hypothetical protein
MPPNTPGKKNQPAKTGRQKNRKEKRFMGDEHRQKRKKFQFWLDDYVYDILCEKAAAARMNKTNFLAHLIVYGKVTVKDLAAIKDLSNEINKIGVNINQIVYHVNARGGGVSEDELRELEYMMIEVQDLFHAATWRD